jgi:hypothetical protein
MPKKRPVSALCHTSTSEGTCRVVTPETSDKHGIEHRISWSLLAPVGRRADRPLVGRRCSRNLPALKTHDVTAKARLAKARLPNAPGLRPFPIARPPRQSQGTLIGTDRLVVIVGQGAARAVMAGVLDGPPECDARLCVAEATGDRAYTTPCLQGSWRRNDEERGTSRDGD